MLILNHIGHSFFDFFNGDVDHVRKLMETNFLSYVAMTVSALPMLKESEGSIVVVSSISGEHISARLSLPCPCLVPFLFISVHALQSGHFCRLTCVTTRYHTFVLCRYICRKMRTVQPTTKVSHAMCCALSTPAFLSFPRAFKIGCSHHKTAAMGKAGAGRAMQPCTHPAQVSSDPVLLPR